ncbi:S1C family serine protease [Nocardioides daejeonensis]|uniref:S1C family serine protease n=1 Tax=Nocardioides daejeonensis TaxID=1046556 RepID=UPI000D740980|nr:trypsin-like peptidase domain-containing protein [Nocardioides daejeonensis]
MHEQTPSPQQPDRSEPPTGHLPPYGGAHGTSYPPPVGAPVGPPPQSGPPTTAFGPVPPRSPARRTAAGLLVAALLVGGASGVGGAALWTSQHDSADAPVRTSQVVDTGTPVAAKGSVQAAASKVMPSVVQIEVSGAGGSGSGSGIILSSDGEILTNAHVTELADGGGQLTVAFSDGTRAKAQLVGSDTLTDLAVIKAEGVSGLTPATLGKSTSLAVGQGVVAVGSPYGLDATVTSGIVSALNRPVEVARDQSGNTTAYAAIQTDAAINPGNSGGPLIDMSGNVVGINSSIRTSGSGDAFGQTVQGGSIGLGFAIPIDSAMPIVDQIRDGQTPTHARLGISVADVRTDDTGATGAQIQDAGQGSAAADAGLRKGDVITRIDDHAISGSDSLIATVRSYRPGDKVTVTYVRGGDQKTTSLTLGSDASDS